MFEQEFEKLGFDEPNVWNRITNEELEQIGFQTGHIKRWRKTYPVNEFMRSFQICPRQQFFVAFVTKLFRKKKFWKTEKKQEPPSVYSTEGGRLFFFFGNSTVMLRFFFLPKLSQPKIFWGKNIIFFHLFFFSKTLFFTTKKFFGEKNSFFLQKKFKNTNNSAKSGKDYPEKKNFFFKNFCKKKMKFKIRLLPRKWYSVGHNSATRSAPPPPELWFDFGFVKKKYLKNDKNFCKK